MGRVEVDIKLNHGMSSHSLLLVTVIFQVMKKKRRNKRMRTDIEVVTIDGAPVQFKCPSVIQRCRCQDKRGSLSLLTNNNETDVCEIPSRSVVSEPGHSRSDHWFDGVEDRERRRTIREGVSSVWVHRLNQELP